VSTPYVWPPEKPAAATPPRAPTPDEVRGLWTHMTERFGCRVIKKGDAAEMKAVAFVLGKLGILDPAEFLKDYATTIGTRIYLPFEIGEPNGDWNLWMQVIVAAHECQHAYRGQKMGFLTYGARYLTSSSQRALFEVEAYRASLEMEWWRSHTMLDPAQVAEHLRGYGVNEADVQVATTALRMAASTIKRGGVINQASSVAIAWLEQHAPGLKAH
jgi:hypothetical protein